MFMRFVIAAAESGGLRRVSMSIKGKGVLLAAGVLGAILAMPALAQGHGGGGGGHAGGGSGHAGGGGGGHAAGAPHFSGGGHPGGFHGYSGAGAGHYASAYRGGGAPAFH